MTMTQKEVYTGNLVTLASLSFFDSLTKQRFNLCAIVTKDNTSIDDLIILCIVYRLFKYKYGKLNNPRK